jgi:hypothetical protein
MKSCPVYIKTTFFILPGLMNINPFWSLKNLIMKKISLPMMLVLLAVSFFSEGQLNYMLSAEKQPFVPLSGGTVPHLRRPPFTNTLANDFGMADIPLGFTFRYNNTNYTHAQVNVNGFLSFTDDVIGVYDLTLMMNNMMGTGPMKGRPVIAAFWDALKLPDTLNLTYKTTGTAPSRVFIIEWKKAIWKADYPFPPNTLPPGSTEELISFQVKLYETTNVIEFHYKDEGNEPADPGPLVRRSFYGSTIGISSHDWNRDFICLQDASADPKISMLKVQDRIITKPGNNQVYRFTPARLPLPVISRDLYRYTNNAADFNLDAGISAEYEYALTHSPLPPVSEIKSSHSKNISLDKLSPSTVYYLFARTRLKNEYSQWSCDSFKTATNPVPLPYMEDFESATNNDGGQFNLLPDNMRFQDFNDTAAYFYPTSDSWPGVLPFYFDGINSSLIYDQGNYPSADVWEFTPGMKLKKGKKYRFSFSYASVDYYGMGSDEPAKLEVMYGMDCGAGGMNSGLLFRKTDILNGNAFRDTTIVVIPQKTGVYYFGFHNFSNNPFDEEDPGGFLLLDNISVTQISRDDDDNNFITLNGSNEKDCNILNWQSMISGKVASYELQRSWDGMHYSSIAGFNAGTEKNAIFRKNDNYRFKDATMGSDGIYYRVLVKDDQGRSRLSNTVFLKGQAPSVNDRVLVYPNPSAGSFNLHLGKPDNAKTSVNIYDVTGQLVESHNNIINTDCKVGNDLIPGVYFIKVLKGEKLTELKIIRSAD